MSTLFRKPSQKLGQEYTKTLTLITHEIHQKWDTTHKDIVILGTKSRGYGVWFSMRLNPEVWTHLVHMQRHMNTGFLYVNGTWYLLQTKPVQYPRIANQANPYEDSTNGSPMTPVAHYDGYIYSAID